MSFIAVFIASILGSAHCAGMCGGFAAFCAGHGDSSIKGHSCYNLGRLFSYLCLGALAGLLGQSIDDLGFMLGIQRVAAVLSGAVLLYWGLKGFILKQSAFESTFKQTGLVGAIYKRLLSKDSEFTALHSFYLGTASALLPCGWLYSFIAVAVASAHYITGAGIMFAFWLGSVPALLSIGVVIRTLRSRYPKFMPQLTSGLLVFAGFVSISTHFGLFQQMNAETAGKVGHCHSSAVQVHP